MVPVFTGHLSASHGLLPAFKGLCSMPAVPSGVLIIRTPQDEAELAVSDQGLIVGAIIKGKSEQGLFALKKILDWKTGEFAFFDINEYPDTHIKKTLRMDMLSIVRGIEGASGGAAAPQGAPAASPQVAPQAPPPAPMAAPPVPNYQQAPVQPVTYQSPPQQPMQAQAPQQSLYGGAGYSQQQSVMPPKPQAPPTAPPAPMASSPAPAAKKKARKFASTNFAMDVFSGDENPSLQKKSDDKVDDLMTNLSDLNRLGPSNMGASSGNPRSTQSSMSTSQTFRGPGSSVPAPDGLMPPSGLMPPAGLMPPSMASQPAPPTVPASSHASAMSEIQRQAIADEAALRQSMANMPAAMPPANYLQPAAASMSTSQGAPAAALPNLMGQGNSGGYPASATSVYSPQSAPHAVPQAPAAPAASALPPSAPQPVPVPTAPAPLPQAAPQAQAASLPPAAPLPPTAQKKGKPEVTATLIEAPIFTDDALFEGGLTTSLPDPASSGSFNAMQQSQSGGFAPVPHPAQTGTRNDAAQAGTNYNAVQSGTDYNAVQSGTDYNTAQSGTNYNAVQSGTNYNAAQSGTDYNAVQSGTNYNAVSQASMSGTDYRAVPQSSLESMDMTPSSMSMRHAAGGTSGSNYQAAESSSEAAFSSAPSFGPNSDAQRTTTSGKSPGSSILEAMKRRQLGLSDEPRAGANRSPEAMAPRLPEPEPQGYSSAADSSSLMSSNPLPGAPLPPQAPFPPQAKFEPVPSLLRRPEPSPAFKLPDAAAAPGGLRGASLSPESIDPLSSASLDSIRAPRDFGQGAAGGGIPGVGNPQALVETHSLAEPLGLPEGRSGRMRMTKPGTQADNRSFFEKNKMLVIIGVVLLILVLVGGIVGALFAFHIISINPPH